MAGFPAAHLLVSWLCQPIVYVLLPDLAHHRMGYSGWESYHHHAIRNSLLLCAQRRCQVDYIHVPSSTTAQAEWKDAFDLSQRKCGTSSLPTRWVLLATQCPLWRLLLLLRVLLRYGQPHFTVCGNVSLWALNLARRDQIRLYKYISHWAHKDNDSPLVCVQPGRGYCVFALHYECQPGHRHLDDVHLGPAELALWPLGQTIAGLQSEQTKRAKGLRIFGQHCTQASAIIHVSCSDKWYTRIYIYIKDLLNVRLHKELNDIFGMLLAYNIFSTAITLCCIAFYTLLQGITREGIGFFLFFISISAQFYMVCYYGQLLIDVVGPLTYVLCYLLWLFLLLQSEHVAVAAYTQNWYNGSSTYQKHLLLIMQRAQRPAELSAKGVIIISMETFTSVSCWQHKILNNTKSYLNSLDDEHNISIFYGYTQSSSCWNQKFHLVSTLYKTYAKYIKYSTLRLLQTKCCLIGL